jgi:uncharacterized protein YkwD
MAQENNLTVTPFEKRIFDLVNAEREKANAGKASNDPTRLRPVVPNSKLFAAARGHARNMAVQGASHILDGKNPTDRARELGFSTAGYVGENIAFGQITPEATVADWMASTEGHREAILDRRVTIVGVGVAQASNGTYLWCLNYSGVADETLNPPLLVVNNPPMPTPSNRPVPVPLNPPVTVPSPPVATKSGSEPAVFVLLWHEMQLLNAINVARSNAGVPELKINSKLQKIASSHAATMRDAGRMAHVFNGKSPTDRGRTVGYPSEVDEVFNGGGVTAQRVMSDWMEDDQLRAKLLNPLYTEVGVGWTVTPDTTQVWNVTLGNSPEVAHPPTIMVTEDDKPRGGE